MKSILKNALLGILLIAGTAKAVTQAEVEAALKSIIPSGGAITDSALKDNIGTIDVSYPFWLANQFNKLLATGSNTKNCTIRNGILPNALGYVRTLAVDHIAKTSKKLIVVTENRDTICGIQFDIAANGNVTATYKTPTEVRDLLDKSYVQIEHGLSPRQFANEKTAYFVAGLAAIYGLYRLHKWDVDRSIAHALAAVGQHNSKGFFSSLW